MIKVAVISTWGSKCGISTYSEQLCECLINTGEVLLQIIAPNEEGSCATPPPRIPYRLVWNRADTNLPVNIPDIVEEYDIVHVQHEFGLFLHHDAFIHALRILRKKKKKVVVTMHTVTPYGTWQSGVIDSIRSNADLIITHTMEAYVATCLARGAASVARVNHGTLVNVLPGDKTKGFDFLGIKHNVRSASFGGVIGFMGPGKNIHETIKAWGASINRRMIDPTKSALLICGDLGNDVSCYSRVLDNHKRDCGYSENIFIVRKFIPRDVMRHVMAIFDYAVLNTTSFTLSASGQVHALAAHGVPFAAADRPIYRDATNAGAIPFALDERNGYTLSTINAIAALASHEHVRTSMKNQLKNYAEKTGWPVQAERHLALYKELLGK